MNKKEKKYQFTKMLVAIFLLVVFDQVTKMYFLDKKYFSSFFISIYSTKNTGSAFSIFSGVDYYNYLVIFISVIVLGIIFWKRKFFLRNIYHRYFFILVVAGIVGNLIDRLFLGYVRDFIVIKHFFIFNLADAYLNLAFVCFLIYEFLEFRKEEKHDGQKS